MIRILVSLESETPSRLFCQIWFQDEMIVSQINYIESLAMYEDEFLKSYMMVCPLPPAFTHKIPGSVSLVENSCDKPTNNLKVIYNLPPTGDKKQSFVVCSKQLSILDDQSLQIAEWFEILAALGAEKIDLKTIGTHKNIDKVSMIDFKA